MSMLIRIDGPRDTNGNSRGGWLVLDYQGPNVFHVDDQSKTVSEIQKMYGGVVKTEIRVGGVEYRRLRDKTITR